MPSRLWKFRIRDILDAIARVQAYVEVMTFEQFRNERKTLDAVERNFILIGEAARLVPKHVQEAFPEVPWRDMSDMRNYVVHRYWGIEAQRIWDTIHEDLPPLVPMLRKVLGEAPE
jgi:uncharacterized protein with HEPN domain